MEKMAKNGDVPIHVNPVALRKSKIVYNFDLPECNRVKHLTIHLELHFMLVKVFRKGLFLSGALVYMYI